MPRFELTEIDDFATVVREDGSIVGRALTERDGNAFVEEMNKYLLGAEMRDRLLSEITDVIESAFEK